MSNDRPSIPPEAVDLYTQYIHGDLSRRDFLNGLNRFTVLGLTAGAIADALMPNYALAQQVAKTDERIKASNNDATPERYNKAAADEAWQRTIAWFNKYVRG
jgi:hypothetical protein